MKFVTRKSVKVDRVACPWLISRFVDPAAEFLFAEPDDVMTVAQRDGAIPFDVPGAELGHHGAECSFDAVIKKYAIRAPGLDYLALVVRGADTDAKDLVPEARGLEAIADGFPQCRHGRPRHPPPRVPRLRRAARPLPNQGSCLAAPHARRCATRMCRRVGLQTDPGVELGFGTDIVRRGISDRVGHPDVWTAA